MMVYMYCVIFLSLRFWIWSFRKISFLGVTSPKIERIYFVLGRVGVIKIVIVINCNLITFS